ncbi:GGDEF domain-containing protein [Motiliproteus coralliicola]|uniref:diguanylate cyclase n=1 Tax=Motiliproteus coralliicola TaxID=2283196 RepID=A0A369WQR2_9GAMM|nr:GGDEF domain-containing protein [Motiliproteus coralliicola]RDE22954.1 GGDEF domain-containing protein [Motiliproteus coralliicola]
MRPSNNVNAFALHDQVGDFCRDHKIQPVPLNYMVSFEHLSGNHPELSEELTDYVSLGHQLNHSFILQLHQNHLEPQSQELIEGTQQVQQMIDSLLTSVRGGSSSVDELTHSLDESIGELENNPTLEKLELVVSNLLQASMQAKKDQQQLNQQLQQAEANAEKLQQQLNQTHKQAMTDPLTGMLNRTGMSYHLERLRQLDDIAISMVVFDIDHFKRFNDNYGHLLGDKVLQQVANQIKQMIGKEDLAIRYGGEEMLVILPQANLPQAVKIAERIRQQVGQVKLVNKRTKQTIPSVTLSAGVAQMHPSEDWQDWMERADQALYKAKDAGRNQVMVAQQAGVA